MIFTSTTMHSILVSVLLGLLPLAATTPVQNGDLQSNAQDALVNTTASLYLATNDGNDSPFGLDDKRAKFACAGGYGICPNYPDVCCPIGGHCCVNKRCCGPGYYCIWTFTGMRCCPNGYTCNTW
ncbi:unnamed protein product [Rhizoctonia solani]|uniref:Transmembrane protein n=1 Tax=Rhizoctonia solani AG-3 Rhs1AP TaxID=1086054 RepID=X8IV19_9AGAM|nr:hypothetical protein RSOL_013290 [Rhizoctonia solani AG-3 Rhs1AP]CAE6416588.1 unnamed protein product [Rhizoctonia solani]